MLYREIIAAGSEIHTKHTERTKHTKHTEHTKTQTTCTQTSKIFFTEIFYSQISVWTPYFTKCFASWKSTVCILAEGSAVFTDLAFISLSTQLPRYQVRVGHNHFLLVTFPCLHFKPNCLLHYAHPFCTKTYFWHLSYFISDPKH